MQGIVAKSIDAPGANTLLANLLFSTSFKQFRQSRLPRFTWGFFDWCSHLTRSFKRFKPVPDWQAEYGQGQGKELYDGLLPKHLSGRTFGEIVTVRATTSSPFKAQQSIHFLCVHLGDTVVSFGTRIVTCWSDSRWSYAAESRKRLCDRIPDDRSLDCFGTMVFSLSSRSSLAHTDNQLIRSIIHLMILMMMPFVLQHPSESRKMVSSSFSSMKTSQATHLHTNEYVEFDSVNGCWPTCAIFTSYQ